MPATPSPVGSKGPLNPWWNAIISTLQQLQTDVTALQGGAQQTVTVDQYGNAIIVSGQLNQVVTIGASFGQAGVLVGTNLPAANNPNAGLVAQTGLVTTTITTTKGSASATVGSGTGLQSGMVIGAADVTDPTSGVATSAITPGTTISSISGTSVTLSENAAESGSGLYCAACFWLPEGTPAPVTALPANPYHGQAITYYADATNGVRWTFQYNAYSSSAHKWECIGGRPIVKTDNTNPVGVTTPNTGALTSIGSSVSIPLPFAGDYDVVLSAVPINTGATLTQVRLIPAYSTISLPTGVDALRAFADILGNSAQGDWTPLVANDRVTGAAAGQALIPCYESTAAAVLTIGFYSIYMAVTPVRVG